MTAREERAPGRGAGSRSTLLFGAAVSASGIAIFAQVYSMQGLLPPIAAELQVPASTAALVLSATTLGIAIGAIPWALLSERIGRVPVIRLCMIASAVLAALSALAPDFTSLVALRLLTGLAVGGLPALVVSYITERAATSNAVRMIGLYIAGTTLGGLSGRVIGSVFGETLGWRVGVAASAILSAGCAAVFLLWSARTAPAAAASTRAKASFRDIWRPGLLVLYAQGALLMGAWVSLFNYLGFHVAEPPFDIPRALVFLFFFAYVMSWAAAPLTTAVVARLGDRWALALAELGLICGFAVVLIPHLAAMIAGLIILALTFFSAHATASRMTAEAGGASRALASSFYVISFYVGGSLFGWLSGVVYENGGWAALIAFCAGLIALALAAIALWGAGARLRAGALSGRGRP